MTQRKGISVDVKEFKQRGACLIKGFFDKRKIESLRRDAKNVFIKQLVHHGYLKRDPRLEHEFESALFKYFEEHLQEFMNCGKQIQHLISLHRLSLEPNILQELKRLKLTRPNISTRPVLFFNSRRLAKEDVYWRVFPHQDWRSMQGSLDSIVVWVPLIDTDASLGALEVVPGSHKRGLVTQEVVNSFGKVDLFKDEDFEKVEVKQGDALFFSSFLVHRSGTNSTESIRWSCHFRYNNLDEATFVERGYPHPYIYQPKDDLITPDFPRPEQVQKLFE
jgi:phytanoyl-CoA hydroxylase